MLSDANGNLDPAPENCILDSYQISHGDRTAAAALKVEVLDETKVIQSCRLFDGYAEELRLEEEHRLVPKEQSNCAQKGYQRDLEEKAEPTICHSSVDYSTPPDVESNVGYNVQGVVRDVSELLKFDLTSTNLGATVSVEESRTDLTSAEVQDLFDLFPPGNPEHIRSLQYVTDHRTNLRVWSTEPENKVIPNGNGVIHAIHQTPFSAQLYDNLISDAIAEPTLCQRARNLVADHDREPYPSPLISATPLFIWAMWRIVHLLAVKNVAELRLTALRPSDATLDVTRTSVEWRRHTESKGGKFPHIWREKWSKGLREIDYVHHAEIYLNSTTSWTKQRMGGYIPAWLMEDLPSDTANQDWHHFFLRSRSTKSRRNFQYTFEMAMNKLKNNPSLDLFPARTLESRDMNCTLSRWMGNWMALLLQ